MCMYNIKRLHFGVNFGIEREHCLSIEWVWSIWANAGCHEHRRSKIALMNIQMSKCDPYREKFLLKGIIESHIHVGPRVQHLRCFHYTCFHRYVLCNLGYMWLYPGLLVYMGYVHIGGAFNVYMASL